MDGKIVIKAGEALVTEVGPLVERAAPKVLGTLRGWAGQLFGEKGAGEFDAATRAAGRVVDDAAALGFPAKPMADAALDGTGFSGMVKRLASPAESARAQFPGLDTYGNLGASSERIAAKFNAGQVTRGEFDEALAGFTGNDRPLAQSLLMRSMPNISDGPMQNSVMSVTQKLADTLAGQGSRIDKIHRFYTLDASSEGNGVAYLVRKRAGAELGINSLDRATIDATRMGKEPINLFDNIATATPAQLEQIRALGKATPINIVELPGLSKGINFIDFAQGRTGAKLESLVKEARDLQQANPALRDAPPDKIAQALFEGPQNAVAKDLGIPIIRPTAQSEAELFRPRVTSDDVMKHLQTAYKTPEDRAAAADILQNVSSYWDLKTMSQKTVDLRDGLLFKAGQDAIRTQGGDAALAKATVEQIEKAGREQEHKFLYVIGYDGGDAGNRAASSGSYISYMYKEANKLPDSQFVSAPKLEEMLKAGTLGDRKIVYLDDIAYEGAQLSKRMHGDLNKYDDVTVGMLGSYDRLVQRFSHAEPGRSMVNLDTFFPFKTPRESQYAQSLAGQMANAGSDAQRAAFASEMDRVSNRIRFMKTDGSGTYSISGYNVMPYFTPDNGTRAVVKFAQDVMRIPNPREQAIYKW